jgi:hypothetical protein
METEMAVKSRPQYVAMVESMGCPACHSGRGLRYGAVTTYTSCLGDHETFVTHVQGTVTTREVRPVRKTEFSPSFTIDLECTMCRAPEMNIVIWQDKGRVVIQTRQPVPEEDVN